MFIEIIVIFLFLLTESYNQQDKSIIWPHLSILFIELTLKLFCNWGFLWSEASWNYSFLELSIDCYLHFI